MTRETKIAARWRPRPGIATRARFFCDVMSRIRYDERMKFTFAIRPHVFQRSARRLLILCGCLASFPLLAQSSTPPQGAAEARAKNSSKAIVKPDPAKRPAADARPLSSAQLLYQLMIAEIAGQRGRVQLASRGMLDLAQKSRDARLARRAAEIAFQSRQVDEALEALLLWLDLEPESAIAKQALGALVGTQGPIDAVGVTLSQWLAAKSVAPGLFEQLPLLLARYPDRERVANLVAELALPYASLPEAQFALGMSAFGAGRMEAASAALDAALRGRPGFSKAAIAKAQLLRARAADGSNELALQFLAGYLKQFAPQTEVRVVYARLLVNDKSLLLAREEFRRASNELPNDGELVYAGALISLQIEDWDAATAGFKRSLQMDPRDRNPILFNLALAAEGRKDIEQALAEYRQISAGEYFVPAQLKVASHLAKRDGIDSGRKHLQDLQQAETESPELKAQLILAEAQLLRDAGALREAHQVLSVALASQPESIPLRYDRAMLAEKLDKLDEMESDLRTVMKIKPDHAHAYNALGYSLADRGLRLDESYTLIRKAVELAPEDAFILDSLGWVQFKLKRVDEALATLTRAYRMRPDPEIAAHLGEVLWTIGKVDAAREIWARALIENPEHPTLTALIERFKK